VQKHDPAANRVFQNLDGVCAPHGLPIDAIGRLDASEVRFAKTASRHVLGVMNQMAFEIGWHVEQAGGLGNIEIDELNSHLRRSLHTKDGDYQVPLNSCTTYSKPARNDATPDHETAPQPRTARTQAPRPESGTHRRSRLGQRAGNVA
jgi:hypothetical protein